MKTAEQFRLGNWVKSNFHKSGLETEIFSILNSDKVRLGCNPLAVYSFKDNDFEPIELTEEWLLKMRLKWSEEHKVYYNNGFNIEKIGEMLLERRYGIILKHVHQVQNFYNIVTNQELTIK